MRIARGGHAPAVQIASLVQLAQFLQSLPAVEVRRRVSGVDAQDTFELGHRGVERAALDVLHGETIARESVRGVLRQKLLKDFETVIFQSGFLLLGYSLPCPFFLPETPVHAEGRMPLGDEYRGSCHSNPSEPFVPEEARQHELCNFGYARGRCQRFHGDVDAVRFSIAEDRLIWVLERDHAPIEHGLLAFDQPARDDVLAAQAGVFVENYRRRLGRGAAT